MSDPVPHVDVATSSAPTGTLHLRFLSDPAELAPVRKETERFCRASGLSDTACDELGLCVNEAVANVIRHAYAGVPGRPIELTARQVQDNGQADAGGRHAASRRGVEVLIRDWGDGVNPETLPQREPDPLTPGGLGLICMRRMMSRVVFSPQPDGMLLQLLRFDDRSS